MAAVITSVPEPNLWNEICKEAALMRPPFRDDDQLSVATVLEDYDPKKHSPVFFGNVMHKKISTDEPPVDEFNPSVSHPACVGYAFVSRPPPGTPPASPPPPDKKLCRPREYLEHYVFPVLLPAIEQMLHQAKLEKCFERKRTKFNACDFLTEYLYKQNPLHSDRESLSMGDIPFVKSWWQLHPRCPLPKSVLWSEAEAAQIIQNMWQGYKVRADPHVQELRQWQREWRTVNEIRATLTDTTSGTVSSKDAEDGNTVSTTEQSNDDVTDVMAESTQLPADADTQAGSAEWQQPDAEPCLVTEVDRNDASRNDVLGSCCSPQMHPTS